MKLATFVIGPAVIAAAIGVLGGSEGPAPAELAPAEPAPAELAHAKAAEVSPDAEGAFFDALNRHPERRAAALAGLRQRVIDSPEDARAVLLLGVAHLWTAAENPPGAGVAFEHVVLARHYLARAAALNPADDRIPTWLLSAEISIAQSEGRGADAEAALAALRAHAERDPCFHSVAFAICVWDGSRDRAELAEAQRYLERAAACNADNPSVRNMERWPHNVEGFLVAMSDVALKRGDRNRALGALVAAESWPGAESWPHREQVEVRRRDFEARAALFADGDSANDPPFVLDRGGPVSCVACHQAPAAP